MPIPHLDEWLSLIGAIQAARRHTMRMPLLDRELLAAQDLAVFLAKTYMGEPTEGASQDRESTEAAAEPALE